MVGTPVGPQGDRDRGPGSEYYEGEPIGRSSAHLFCCFTDIPGLRVTFKGRTIPPGNRGFRQAEQSVSVSRLGFS